MDSICTVILAAGKGKRLKTSFPKPLAPVLGRKMVDHVISRISVAGIKSTFCAVTGHGKEEVEEHIKNQAYYKNEKIEFALQAEQLGTGHALKCAFADSKLVSSSHYTLVVCADTPCLEPETILELSKLGRDHEAVVVTFTTEKPTGYGRVFDNGVGGVKIIEEKDANEEQRSQKTVNSGVYLFKTSFLKESLEKLNSDNAASEYYLTDIIKILIDDNKKVSTFKFTDELEVTGVNSKIDLVNLEQQYLRQKAENL